MLVYKRVLGVLSLGLFLCTNQVLASEKSKVSKFDLKVDIKSQHVWRGMRSADLPCIEPTASFTSRNFNAGVWAAQSMDGIYTELDIFLNYTYKYFTFSLLDYYVPPTDFSEMRFFNYQNHSTQHLIDVSIRFNGTKKFPINLFVSTMVYGDDKDPVHQNNTFSTYFEINYSKDILNSNLNLFLGMTPGNSFYHDKFGVVNAGIKTVKNLKLKNRVIPFDASLITNPVQNQIYLVFGLTL